MARRERRGTFLAMSRSCCRLVQPPEPVVHRAASSHTSCGAREIAEHLEETEETLLPSLPMTLTTDQKEKSSEYQWAVRAGAGYNNNISRYLEPVPLQLRPRREQGDA